MKISTIKRLFVGLFVISLFFVARFMGIQHYITIDSMRENMFWLQCMVHKYYVLSVMSYICFYIFTITFSLPFAAVLTLAGGFFFGTLRGAVFANIGATVGSTCSFLLVRYVAGKPLQRKYKQQLQNFNKEFKKYGIWYLIVVHSIVIIPLFLVNILAGLTKVSVWTFMWTTSVSILPGGLVYAFAGKQLHTINSTKDIFSPSIIGAFILLGLISLLPILIKRLVELKRSKKK